MGLWALLGVIAWITKYFPGKYNNFSIFRQSFWHTLNELPLYAAYPEEYNDIFHYGPVFSLVVAPFAITPLWLGLLTWSYEAFRKTLLASVLMFVVLFSTGSESSTYIIAFIGVAIWYTAVPWKRSTLDIVLMVFAFILTSMSPSDLFPKYIRVHYVYPYALKALPCMLIWLKLTFEMCTRSYNPVKV